MRLDEISPPASTAGKDKILRLYQNANKPDAADGTVVAGFINIVDQVGMHKGLMADEEVQKILVHMYLKSYKISMGGDWEPIVVATAWRLVKYGANWEDFKAVKRSLQGMMKK